MPRSLTEELCSRRLGPGQRQRPRCEGSRLQRPTRASQLTGTCTPPVRDAGLSVSTGHADVPEATGPGWPHGTLGRPIRAPAVPRSTPHMQHRSEPPTDRLRGPPCPQQLPLSAAHTLNPSVGHHSLQPGWGAPAPPESLTGAPKLPAPTPAPKATAAQPLGQPPGTSHGHPGPGAHGRGGRGGRTSRADAAILGASGTSARSHGRRCGARPPGPAAVTEVPPLPVA